MVLAIRVLEYSIERDAVARACHEKAWRKKHQGVEFVLL